LVGEIVDKSSDRPLEQRRQLKGTLEEIRQQVVAYSAAGVEEIVIDANSLDFEASVDFYRVFYREVVALTQS